MAQWMRYYVTSVSKTCRLHSRPYPQPMVHRASVKVVVRSLSRMVTYSRSSLPSNTFDIRHAFMHVRVTRSLATDATSSRTSAEAQAFTSSIEFKRVASSDKSTVGGNHVYVFEFRIPNKPVAIARVTEEESLRCVMLRISEATGAADVAVIRNGEKIVAESIEAEKMSLKSLFGTAVELVLFDGLRYNVNRGHRLTPLGFSTKRSLALSYAYTAASASLLLFACLGFWFIVVPPEHRRWNPTVGAAQIGLPPTGRAKDFSHASERKT